LLTIISPIIAGWKLAKTQTTDYEIYRLMLKKIEMLSFFENILFRRFINCTILFCIVIVLTFESKRDSFFFSMFGVAVLRKF